MAKFQKQEATSESPEGDSLLEEIIPPPALPSLTTLSGKIPDIQPKAPDDEVDLSKISTSGPALSTEDEDSIKSFLAGVAEEVKIVEWPSFSRVLRLTFIILVTLVSAVVALYFVDGFFYRISHVLFDV